MKAIQDATDKLSANMTPNYEIALLFILLCTVGAGIVVFLIMQYNRLAAIANKTNERLLSLHEENTTTLMKVVSANTVATEENSRLMGAVTRHLEDTRSAYLKSFHG
ncbi:MAG TPA: hypothetical protein VHC95_07115 [Opitutales bacterium]|nr:hypothetical protein [Opitutales bacterium]